MEHLKKRKDFLAAAEGRSQARPGFVLQVRARGDTGAPRLGLTVTKKLGNAVARNRIRRRLREAARFALDGRALPGHDYVLIARRTTGEVAFDRLIADLRQAVDKLQRAAHIQDRGGAPARKNEPVEDRQAASGAEP
jgi:ribonuclease P protein component